MAGPIEARLRWIVARLPPPHAKASNAAAASAAAASGGGGSASAAVAQQVEEVAGLYAGLARAVDNSGASDGIDGGGGVCGRWITAVQAL